MSVSQISSLSNSSLSSLRQESKQTWRIKPVVKVCNFGLKSTFSASFSKGSIARNLSFRRHRPICASMAVEVPVSDETMDQFVEVVHKLADTAREITLKYFRSKFQIIEKADLSKFTRHSF